MIKVKGFEKFFSEEREFDSILYKLILHLLIILQSNNVIIIAEASKSVLDV